MPVITLERPAPGIAVLTLDRPHVRNAISSQTWPECLDALAMLAREPLAALVIAGNGSSFCAGGDLRDDGPAGHGVLDSGLTGRVNHSHQVLEAIQLAPYPVLAAVSGAAVGVGWSLALACDLVVADRDATFSAPFLARGAIPDGLIWWRLTRICGSQFAADVLYTGRIVTASQAQNVGLVARLSAPGQARATALEMATALVHCPLDTVTLLKRMLRQAEDVPLPAAAQLELATVALNLAGGAPTEGRRAYREKRPARFPTPFDETER